MKRQTRGDPAAQSYRDCESSQPVTGYVLEARARYFLFHNRIRVKAKPGRPGDAKLQGLRKQSASCRMCATHSTQTGVFLWNTGKRQTRGDPATQSYRGCESSQPAAEELHPRKGWGTTAAIFVFRIPAADHDRRRDRSPAQRTPQPIRERRAKRRAPDRTVSC